jgi:hypothetical protein
MQRSTGQYDYLSCLPRTGPRQSRSRRSFASRHRCRATPRRARRMEPTVRTPRIESAIGFPSCSKPAFQQTIPERRLVSCRPKFSRRERNFWMQRPEAKNPPERPLISVETGTWKMAGRNPAETACFRSRTVSLVRVDWMVETIWTKLPAPHAGIEPSLRSRARNGIFRRRDGPTKWAHSPRLIARLAAVPIASRPRTDMATLTIIRAVPNFDIFCAHDSLRG